MENDKKQIYIIDDDESVCRALKFFLRSFGFIVDTFSSTENFFNAVSNSARGCLILDIHMPGMNGWEALKLMIKSGCRRPVIIISGDKNQELTGEALRRTGAVGFFQKPIDGQSLVDLINTVY